MYLFVDTETTGLPKAWNAPHTDLNNWPRMVQVAWLLYDSQGTCIEAQDAIIYPDGFFIPNEVANIHGITQNIALSKGKPITDVLTLFTQTLQQADYLVAHNLSFDEAIIASELYRYNILSDMTSKQKICTMKSTVEYCQLLDKRGKKKFPKLSELYFTLFGQSFTNAHNAKADIQATADCFWKLKSLDVL